MTNSGITPLTSRTVPNYYRPRKYAIYPAKPLWARSRVTATRIVKSYDTVCSVQKWLYLYGYTCWQRTSWSKCGRLAELYVPPIQLFLIQEISTEKNEKNKNLTVGNSIGPTPWPSELQENGVPIKTHPFSLRTHPFSHTPHHVQLCIDTVCKRCLYVQ